MQKWAAFLCALHNKVTWLSEGLCHPALQFGIRRT